MITLGIETSCDETAIGIVNEKREVLANVLYSQFDEHAHYGGVVPEIAARAHLEKIKPIYLQAIKEAGITPQDIDLIAVLVFLTSRGILLRPRCLSLNLNLLMLPSPYPEDIPKYLLSTRDLNMRC